jgi:hypothetical protein
VERDQADQEKEEDDTHEQGLKLGR